MRAVNTIGYWLYVIALENIDPCTTTMRTDDYRGRYRTRWWHVFDNSKFTRAS